MGGAAAGPAEAGTPSLLTEKPGDRIGRYKLLQKIGEGGCGVVYMAEQEEPVRRRVALKIIKLGMDTRQVIARFEAERQALALMDHPNIAKVFDAGATGSAESEISNLESQIPGGRPYFVMELVRGVSIPLWTNHYDSGIGSSEAFRIVVDASGSVFVTGFSDYLDRIPGVETPGYPRDVPPG